MTNETLGNMWAILRENDFQIDVSTKSELVCSSCQKIMVKPCNVPCGCRYCYDCLRNYLNGKEKYCLGEAEYCKIELINVDNNVCFDQVANIKISRIVVKCPLESCEFETELGKMAIHLRTCDRQPVTCPYYTIGCDENKIGADKMKQHFKQESYCHAKLLMDFVDNWRNEIKLLTINVNEQMGSKQRILELEQDVAKLLKENKSVEELEIAKCHENNQIKEVILEMFEKSKEQNCEIEKYARKLGEMEINQEQMRNRIETMAEQNTNLQEDLQMMKLDNKTKEKMISVLELESEGKDQEIRKIKEKCELLVENQEQMKTEINKISQENAAMATKSKESENLMKVFETKLMQLQPGPGCDEFRWCIGNLKERVETARSNNDKFICSDPFHFSKPGYRMCLVLSYFKHFFVQHWSLGICIMKGDFDNGLQWPFRDAVKLETINPETGLTLFDGTVRSTESPTSEAWKKPTKERNVEYVLRTADSFDLYCHVDLFKVNQILIKASLERKP